MNFSSEKRRYRRESRIGNLSWCINCQNCLPLCGGLTPLLKLINYAIIVVQGGVQVDQKVMELLANIYQNQTEMRSELKELKDEVKELRVDVNHLKDDVFELKNDVNQLKGDVSKLNNDVNQLKGDVSKLKSDQESIAQNVTKIITIVEHDTPQKIEAIFDFRQIQIEHNQMTGQALERIEAKVEVLQLETSHLRRIK